MPLNDAVTHSGRQGLRHNRDFRLLWTGSAFSFLGVETADIAYPLLILAVTGSAAKAGLFGAVQLIATLATGLLAGHVVDTHDKRRILITAEGCRMLATGSVAAVLLTSHALSFSHLLLAAGALGAATPFSGASRMLIVRAVVPTPQLTSALTQEEVRTSAAALVGPPLGGALYGVGQAVPFVAVAVCFVVSSLLALFIRLPATAHHGAPSRTAGLLAGVRLVLTGPTLRAATLLVMVLNGVGAPMALVAVVSLREQHTSSTMIGIAMAGLAIGGLAGAALVGRLHRLQPGLLLLGLAAFEVPVLAGLALPWGPWWVALMLFLAMLGVPALRVLVDVLIFRQVKPELRGRVIAAVMTMFGLGAPLGVGTSGVLLEHWSPSGTVLVFSTVVLLSTVLCASRRELRQAQWPQEHAS